ncbi:helix-turn-helix transcriptional regulator [Aquirhabdus sp.]|uniref:helix-turn-helix transcriptional regulator n=1 Tax=Aquirhabdus sp. TaxID=2824160 RepID=UPI00396C808B
MTTSVLLSLSTLCAKLGTSRHGIRKIAARDPSFPSRIKMGNTRQARVFYDAIEIENWLKSKKIVREDRFNACAGNSFNALLWRQFQLKYRQFMHVSNAISQAGWLLNVGGKQLKPKLKRELIDLGERLQLSLPLEGI